MIRRFASSSPRQTFLLMPLAVLGAQLLTRRRVTVRPIGVPLLVLGYGLFRYAGRYRAEARAGPAGFTELPDHLLTDGPYAWTRNPMYLGHLVFMAGLVLATRAPLALVFAARQLARFQERVRIDEARLAERFGDEYRGYLVGVPRWLPRVPGPGRLASGHRVRSTA